MVYTLKADGNTNITLSPESVIAEVLQNVFMIISTTKYSAPLDRNFGLSAEFIDKQTPVAESLLTAELYDAIEEYEPRAEIVNISFERNEFAGKIIPCIELEVVLEDDGE